MPYDFSPQSARDRWNAGRLDMEEGPISSRPDAEGALAPEMRRAIPLRVTAA
jgi:hypothetical protein